MTAHDAHLEQIGLSAASISELSFSQPGPFSNALLRTHDITALIRDTEPHERSLFSVATQHDSGAGGNLKKSNVRRGTVFAKLGQQLPFEDEQPTTRRLRFGSRSHGATVGALLGEGMSRELEKASKQVGGDGAGRKDDVDIELLLAGADRLCTIYPMPDISSRAEASRARFRKLQASISHHRSTVDGQNQRLELLDHQRQQQLRHDPDAEEEAAFPTSPPRTTLADLHKEERMIRELEQKKRVLGERVTQLDSSLQQS